MQLPTFPAQEAPPPLPLRKPETGLYHPVRFIWSDRRLDVFGERFLLPLQAQYEYIVATVEVKNHRLQITLHRDPIEQSPYQLR